MSARSTDPEDYQGLPQPIGAMSKRFADGHVIPMHHHARDQLLFAASGIMRLQTERQAWLVPADGAISIPGGTRHSVRMYGAVDMRTLYIDTATVRMPPRPLSVISVSALLRELILALSEEPMRYAPGGRGDQLARLIETEIGRAPELALQVPLPTDVRLQRLCGELMANPSDRRTLDGWSDVVGASPRTLARLFERDLEMGFTEWRRRVRFQGAMEALSRGERVSVVASKHGYRSPSAFTSAFRKVMGNVPSEITPGD